MLKKSFKNVSPVTRSVAGASAGVAAIGALIWGAFEMLERDMHQPTTEAQHKFGRMIRPVEEATRDIGEISDLDFD